MPQIHFKEIKTNERVACSSQTWRLQSAMVFLRPWNTSLWRWSVWLDSIAPRTSLSIRCPLIFAAAYQKLELILDALNESVPWDICQAFWQLKVERRKEIQSDSSIFQKLASWRSQNIAEIQEEFCRALPLHLTFKTRVHLHYAPKAEFLLNFCPLEIIQVQVKSEVKTTSNVGVL